MQLKIIYGFCVINIFSIKPTVLYGITSYISYEKKCLRVLVASVFDPGVFWCSPTWIIVHPVVVSLEVAWLSVLTIISDSSMTTSAACAPGPINHSSTYWFCGSSPKVVAQFDDFSRSAVDVGWFSLTCCELLISRVTYVC